MGSGSIRRRTLVSLLLVPLLMLATPTVSRASSLVLPGWDLFETIGPTSFMGIPLVGVPVGSHNFGPEFGVRATGSADTIVRRLDNAGPGDPTELLMEALLLRTEFDVNLGLGLGTYFVTLQSGQPSGGVMDIFFGPEPGPPPPSQPLHGTFNSRLTVFFDIRLGSPTGPIAMSGSRDLLATGFWSHYPPPDALEIAGINTLLNDQDRLSDFWPLIFSEVSPSGDEIHTVRAAVPEPTSLLLLGSGLAAIGSALRRRRRQAQGEQTARPR